MATTYSADQIDELLSRTRAELNNSIENVIVIAKEEGKPSAEKTSVWLAVEEVSIPPYNSGNEEYVESSYAVPSLEDDSSDESD